MGAADFMKATFEEWGERRVRLLSIPLPPIAIRGLVYRPDSFASACFDSQFDLNDKLHCPTESYKAVAARPTTLGPAVLIVTKLKEIIGYNDEGQLSVKKQAVCASVSYQVKFNLKNGKGESFDYAHNVVLKAMNFGSSCNPGSHLTVPEAPYLSALLQYAASPKETYYDKLKIVRSVTYLTPAEGCDAFVGYDFSANREIDRYIASCAVNPGVRYHHNSEGVGEWVIPFLATLRKNFFSLEESPDASRLRQIIGPGQEGSRSDWNGTDRGRTDHSVSEQRDQNHSGNSPILDQGCNGVPSEPGIQYQGEGQSEGRKQANSQSNCLETGIGADSIFNATGHNLPTTSASEPAEASTA